MLIAYDEVTFTASDDSVVYCDSTIDVNGDFYERTQGLLARSIVKCSWQDKSVC